ncbi:MAG: response regulator [Pseudomonadota bacterium]
MTELPDYSNKSAVIVDDNPQMRAIIRSMLGVIGITNVADYSDPQQAIRRLESEHVGLAIIDLVLMSSIDGLAVAEAIRHNEHVKNQMMPIIMVTGYPSIAVIDQAINAGVDELVTKPLRAKDLVSRVQKAFEEPRRYISTPNNYYGPDRRRADRGSPVGEDRRVEDLAVEVELLDDPRSMIARMKPDAFTEQRMVDESQLIYID